MKYLVDIQLMACVVVDAENKEQAYEFAKNVPLMDIEWTRGIGVREAIHSDKN